MALNGARILTAVGVKSAFLVVSALLTVDGGTAVSLCPPGLPPCVGVLVGVALFAVALVEAPVDVVLPEEAAVVGVLDFVLRGAVDVELAVEPELAWPVLPPLDEVGGAGEAGVAKLYEPAPVLPFQRSALSVSRKMCEFEPKLSAVLPDPARVWNVMLATS